MELPKRFENRQNGSIKLSYNNCGQVIDAEYFIHRAIAVVGIVLVASESDGIKVLIVKRSYKMDEGGKFCIPCGYLDWDETAHDAMMREVYEETSLYMPDYEKHVVFDNNKQPFYINDNPNKDKKQNVSLVYITLYDFKDEINQFPMQEIENFSCNETALVKFLKISDLYNSARNYEWAFRHDETIKSALNFYNKGR